MQTAQRSGEPFTTSGERQAKFNLLNVFVTSRSAAADARPHICMCVPQKVQAQLGRIKLLADLNEYDSARLELREGAALGLRRDLRGAEEDYIAIKGEV